ncbi:MAG: APC family permease, partial [Chitinophagaceae bacterium]
MIDMVGIGPFVVMPFVVSRFQDGLFLWAWIFGAFTAFMDAMIWSELGAKYPLAGGTYNFHRIAFGEKKGRLMSFLFVWQTAIQAPLVVASGAIGFAQYLSYLVDLKADAKGKVPKLKKASVILFARPVAGRPAELQLV